MTRELLERCLEWIDRRHWVRYREKSVCLDCGEPTAFHRGAHAATCLTGALIAEIERRLEALEGRP